MAQTGAQKGCCDYYASAIPAVNPPSTACFVDCCDNLCPPDCCTAMIWRFECGEPDDPLCCAGGYMAPPSNEHRSVEFLNDIGITIPELPSSGVADTTDNEVSYEQPFGINLTNVPEFSERITNDLFVLAEGNIKCKCIKLNVTVSAGSICCIQPGGGAVGDGTVGWGPTSYDSGCCGQITITVAGSEAGSTTVSDGDGVAPGVDAKDCSCCQLGMTDPCAALYGTLYIAKRDSRGRMYMVLNKIEILRRVNQIKAAKIRNRINKNRRKQGIRKKAEAKDVVAAFKRLGWLGKRKSRS